MQHCDPETLSLIALGEPSSSADTEHLSRCARCRAEIESLASVVATVREPQLVDAPPLAPPSAVWDRIAAATGVGVEARADVVAANAAPAQADDPDALAAHQEPVRLRAVDGRGSSPATSGAPLPRRFGRAALLLTAAAGVAVGALGGVGLVAAVDDDAPTVVVAPSPRPSVSVVVAARLDPLAAAPRARGSAEVVEQAGARELVVDVADLAGSKGFLEVWLIDRDVKRMVPVGILRGPEGRFVLPEGLDLSQYPIVDISVEPLDGNPTHSGASVLRGVIGS